MDERANPAGIRACQPHRDVVPRGQAGHDEQAEALGDREVEHRRLGQPLVGCGQLLLRHPEAGVVDDDEQSAVVEAGRGEVDREVWRGELGGVLQ